MVGSGMVTEILVPGGIYAGNVAKIYSSDVELAAAFSENQLVDNQIFGFAQSVVPDWSNEGSTYAVGIGQTPTGEIIPLSFHALPDPGWILDVEHGVVIGPNGEYFVWTPALIAMVVAVVKCIAVVLVMVAIAYIVGRLTTMQVTRAVQLSPTIAQLSYPDGASETIDKNTGESLNYESAPSNWGTYLLLGLGIVIVIVVAPRILDMLPRSKRSEVKYTPYSPGMVHVEE